MKNFLIDNIYFLTECEIQLAIIRD